MRTQLITQGRVLTTTHFCRGLCTYSNTKASDALSIPLKTAHLRDNRPKIGDLVTHDKRAIGWKRRAHRLQKQKNSLYLEDLTSCSILEITDHITRLRYKNEFTAIVSLFERLVDENVGIDSRLVAAVLSAFPYQFVKLNKEMKYDYKSRHMLRAKKITLFEHATSIFEYALLKLTPEPELYSAMLSICSKMNNVSSDVDRILDRVHPRDISVEMYTSAMEAYFQDPNRGVEKGWKLFDTAKSRLREPDQRLISVAIRFAAIQGRTRQSLNLFNQMLVEGLYPSTYDFNVLLNAVLTPCSKLAKLKEVNHEDKDELDLREIEKEMYPLAWDVYKKMGQIGVSPDHITINTILTKGCKPKKDLKAGIDLVNTYISDPNIVNESVYACFWDLISDNVASSRVALDASIVLTKEELAQIALEYYETMKEKAIPRNVRTLNSLMSVFTAALLPQYGTD